MMLLTFIAGTVIGVKSAWGALLPAELAPAPAAMFLVYNCGALLLGCVMGGLLIDFFCTRKLKKVLVLSFLATGLLYAGFALEVPSIVSKKPVLPGSSDFARLAWLTAAGVAQGISVPAFFELGAEIAHAKAASAEALSGSLIVFLWYVMMCGACAYAVVCACAVIYACARVVHVCMCACAMFVCCPYNVCLACMHAYIK